MFTIQGNAMSARKSDYYCVFKKVLLDSGNQDHGLSRSHVEVLPGSGLKMCMVVVDVGE